MCSQRRLNLFEAELPVSILVNLFDTLTDILPPSFPEFGAKVLCIFLYQTIKLFNANKFIRVFVDHCEECSKHLGFGNTAALISVKLPESMGNLCQNVLRLILDMLIQHIDLAFILMHDLIAGMINHHFGVVANLLDLGLGLLLDRFN